MRADKLNEQLDKRKKQKDASSEENLRNTFNESAELLVKKFMADVMSGHREIEDTADLARLFSIYMSVNKINEMGVDGTGMLPEVNPTKLTVMEDLIPMETKVVDGEEEQVIDVADLANLTTEDVEKMLMRAEESMNLANEATF